jgi:hypothetical protein
MKRKNKNQESRNNRVNITLSKDEKEMIDVLKKEYSFNISNYFRQSIRALYEKTFKK